MNINKAASMMGKKGGRSKSDAKREAARKNGTLGGRPREVSASKNKQGSDRSGVRRKSNPAIHG